MNDFLEVYKLVKRLSVKPAIMMSGAGVLHFLLLMFYYENQPAPWINITAGMLVFAYPSVFRYSSISCLNRNVDKINAAEENGTYTDSQSDLLRNRYIQFHLESIGAEEGAPRKTGWVSTAILVILFIVASLVVLSAVYKLFSEPSAPPSLSFKTCKNFSVTFETCPMPTSFNRWTAPFLERTFPARQIRYVVAFEGLALEHSNAS